MKNKKSEKLVNLEMNQFYDTVLASFNIIVPSKQFDYKKDEHGKWIEKPPQPQLNNFKNWLTSEYLSSLTSFDWPLKGDLFAFMDIGLPQSQYNGTNAKDVDHLATALLDSMNKIVYDDDKQVTQLIVIKHIDNTHPSFVIAIKCLDKYDKPIFTIPAPATIFED